MTTHPILTSRNEDYGFFRALTVCPHRDRRSAEVWTLSSRLIADAIGVDSEDEMIGIRDFLDSRMGRHFADDVVGNMTGCNIDIETAIASAIRRWQDWRISRKTECCDGIPAGLPYLTGWVQHFAIAAAMAESDRPKPQHSHHDRRPRCPNSPIPRPSSSAARPRALTILPCRCPKACMALPHRRP
jgi:hypothetical protein